MTLAELGWTSDRNEEFKPFAGRGWTPGRIACEHTHLYTVYGETNEWTARVSGKYRYETGPKGDFPAVGDWVALEARPEEGAATIHALLTRRSSFSRKVAGGTVKEQVVAANVDTTFLVSGLDGDFNLRRIERYLTLAWESGTAPVIVLNKADLCEDLNVRLAETEAIAFGVPVYAVSATEDLGMATIRAHISAGKTAVFIGSSGVGKSTLINCLLGAPRQAVADVRADDSRGRHTTTYRELILLPGGGVMIDTPGMRELQLWGDETGLKHAFEDIETLAAHCRFRDCIHEGEPGCAVQAALESGDLAPDRFQGYLKQRKELCYLQGRKDYRARLEEKAKRRKISMALRRMKRFE